MINKLGLVKTPSAMDACGAHFLAVKKDAHMGEDCCQPLHGRLPKRLRGHLLPPDERSSNGDTNALHKVPQDMDDGPPQVDAVLLPAMLVAMAVPMPLIMALMLMRMLPRLYILQ